MAKLLVTGGILIGIFLVLLFFDLPHVDNDTTGTHLPSRLLFKLGKNAIKTSTYICVDQLALSE